MVSSLTHPDSRLQPEPGCNDPHDPPRYLLERVSHEMRTPLTAILGYAGMLAETGDNPDHRKAYLELIQEHGQSLMTIMDQVLDLLMITSHRVPLVSRPCSPWRLIAEIACNMRIRARAKNLTLSVEYVGFIPEVIHTDANRLKQVLIGLVDNALKFTSVGGVRIIVRLAGTPDARRLHFDIIDSGIGMNHSQLIRSFTAFAQVDEALTRRFGGVGLGLTIAQRLVEMLGGELVAQTTPGDGSCFSFSIPTGPLDDIVMLYQPHEAGPHHTDVTARQAVAVDALAGLRILLAEDGPDNQRLISHYLRRAGATVELAGDGREACRQTQAAQEQGEPFDLILMDIQMPEMDGCEATRTLRRADFHQPIIALTAHASSEDRERCLAAGCDDYETKPIDRGKLIDLIRNHVDR